MNLRLPSQSLLPFLSLFQKLNWPDGEDPILFPFTFWHQWKCYHQPNSVFLLLFFLCRNSYYWGAVHNLLPYNFYFYLITFFLSSHLWSLSFSPFIPLLKEHLWPHNKSRRGGEEEFAGLGLHLDAQKGRSCCEELLFGMSAAPCSNVPVYHHCDYVRWLGWPLHHGRLKCGPRVPLDEILALNPSYKHCLPREGFFLFLPLSLSSHFFAFSYSFKRPSSLDHSFCILQLFFVIFASVWCGTGISKAPVSSSSTLY